MSVMYAAVCRDTYDEGSYIDGVFHDKAECDAYCVMKNSVIDSLTSSEFYSTKKIKVLDGTDTTKRGAKYYDCSVSKRGDLTSLDECLKSEPWGVASYLNTIGKLDWPNNTLSSTQCEDAFKSLIPELTEKEKQTIINAINSFEYQSTPEDDADLITLRYYEGDLVVDETEDYINVFSVKSFKEAQDEARKRWKSWKQRR